MPAAELQFSVNFDARTETIAKTKMSFSYKYPFSAVITMGTMVSEACIGVSAPAPYKYVLAVMLIPILLGQDRRPTGS
jgi:hypothetical protein